MWLRRAVTFLFAFILDLHAAKTLTMLYCAAFGCKHDSVRYRVVFFSISSGKTDSSEFTIVGGLDGSLHGMLDFVQLISKSRVLKLIYFIN